MQRGNMSKKEPKIDCFDFIAVEEIPKRSVSSKGSKYLRTVEKFDKDGVRSIQVPLGDTKLSSAAQGFRKAIDNGYKDKIQMIQRNGSLYLQKH
jgi:hypothetical protein